MCDKPLNEVKVFVCKACEDISGVENIGFPKYLSIDQARQRIARKVIERRKILERMSDGVMGTREIVQKYRNEVL